MASVRLTDKQAQADMGSALANADMALGDTKAARATIDSVLIAKPNDVRALTLLGRLDAIDNKLPDAFKNVDAALAASPRAIPMRSS